MADRRTPFVISDERQTLLSFLAYLRESVILKVDGMREAEARRSLVPSGTSLLGLVKHLTMVEINWFQYSLGGTVDSVPSGELTDDDTVASVIAGYRAACDRSNEVVREIDDLDQRCARKGRAPDAPTLRWVLVHMVEETGRHAGHADILREQIDGTVGR